MPMLAAWNRSTLAQFADRLSAAVEQGLDGMDPMPQPFTAGASSSSPEATASGGSSADAPAAQCSHCPVPQEQIRPTSYAEEAERTAGTRAGGTEVCEVLLEGAAAAAQQGHAAQTSGIEYQQHGLVLDKMSPPTPAGRDTRASMIVASPVVRDAVGAPDGSLDEVQATTGVLARQPGSGCTQNPAAPAHERSPPSPGPAGHSASGQQALDSLHTWAGTQMPGDPAVSLVLASAAHTAAADLGLISGIGPLPWPLYLIATRDSFTHHLHVRRTQARASHAQLIVAANIIYNSGRTHFCFTLRVLSAWHAECRSRMLAAAGGADGPGLREKHVLLRRRRRPQQLC